MKCSPHATLRQNQSAVMTKTLEQIQIENRKFILEAILAGNNLRLLKENIADFSGSKLTLSRVLLALKDEQIGFYDDSLGEIWRGEGSFYREDNVEYICVWDLTKETLEEQSEETQRAINKLFNNYQIKL